MLQLFTLNKRGLEEGLKVYNNSSLILINQIIEQNKKMFCSIINTIVVFLKKFLGLPLFFLYRQERRKDCIMIVEVKNLRFLGAVKQAFDKDEMYKTSWFNEEDGSTLELYIPTSADVAKVVPNLQFGMIPKTMKLRFKRRNGEKGWFPSVSYLSIN